VTARKENRGSVKKETADIQLTLFKDVKECRKVLLKRVLISFFFLKKKYSSRNLS
jgi:hypothetical protein